MHSFATFGHSEAAPTGDGDGCTLYDSTAPTITSLIVPARAIPGFVVTWSAQDNLIGVSHYDVRYKSESSGWTDWLVSTPVTQAVFTGPGGHTYTFRVSATDGAGNESYWQTSGQVTVSLVKKYYAAAGRRVAMRADGVVYYLHGDHLGSTTLVTTGAGAEVARQMYLPYGAPRWGSGTLPTDFTFTGQRSEEASLGSLYDYGARMYSPVLGRFLSADTIVPSPGNPQSLNRYAYTLGNPLKFADATGHRAECSDTAGGGCGETGHVDWGGKTTDESWGDYFQRTGMNKLSDRDIAVAMTTPFWASASAVAGGGTLEGGAALVKAAAQELILEGYACAQSGLCRLMLQAALAKLLAGGSPSRVTLYGHGVYDESSDWTTVPEGSSITLYSKHGGMITDDLGAAIAGDNVLPGQYSVTYGPGMRIRNYTLLSLDNLPNLQGTLTVSSDTLLSDLLEPNTEYHWAACTHCWGTPDSYRVWFPGGEGMIDLDGP